MMYRQYENPRELEKQLAEKKRELEKQRSQANMTARNFTTSIWT